MIFKIIIRRDLRTILALIQHLRARRSTRSRTTRMFWSAPSPWAILIASGRVRRLTLFSSLQRILLFNERLFLECPQSPAPPRHPDNSAKTPMIHQKATISRLLVCLLIKESANNLCSETFGSTTMMSALLHDCNTFVVIPLARRLAQVIDIRLEDQAHHCHRRLTPANQLKPYWRSSLSAHQNAL